jgi:hypothetical protein
MKELRLWPSLKPLPEIKRKNKLGIDHPATEFHGTGYKLKNVRGGLRAAFFLGSGKI